MILQALYKLAEQEGLTAYIDYVPKRVAWLAHIDDDGQLLNFVGTHSIPPGGKKPVAMFRAMPRDSERTSGDKAYFLHDKSEYSLGMNPDSEKPSIKTQKRFALFKDCVSACAQFTGDPAALALEKFCASLQDGSQQIEIPEELTASDLIGFVYYKDIDTLISERPAIKDYWEKQRHHGESANDTAGFRCLVTNDLFAEPGLFPQVKKVPGGSASGISLVSINASAFESFGLKGNENALISPRAAEICATTLQRLLDRDYPDPGDTNIAMKRRNIHLGADTAVCFWAATASGKRPSGDILADAMAGLLEADPATVGELYKSVWRGSMPDIDDPSAFYVLTLSGAQGRVTVRDWIESTVADTARHIAAHYNDLHMVRNTPSPRKGNLPPALSLRALLEGLAVRGERKDIPSHVAAALARSALTGVAYPTSILQRAMQRYRAELGREHDDNDWWKAKAFNDARAALIKAALNRRLRFAQTKPFKEATPEMDPENNDTGYLLGRLMALVERMQQLAMGDPNASVVDRFFSGASASPAAVFPRLMRNLRHHARKAKDDQSRTGTARWLESLIDELCSRISQFPPHLSLEQQGLFILGFHQQRHELWRKKKSADEPESPQVENEQ